MTVRGGLLATYRLLLQLYPPGFRTRFAPEMLELAEAAEPGEWPLIFGDTSVAIVRCWLEGSHSPAVLAQPNAYLSLGESPVRLSTLLHGLVLSVALIVGLYYVSYLWPASIPQCGHRLTQLVAPSYPHWTPNSSESAHP